MLDEYLRHDNLLSRVSTAWTRVARLREQLERVGMEAGEREARLELVTYQLNEIQRLGLKPGEDEELAILKQVLASAERVQRLCDESHAALYESDNAALGILSAARKRLAELASIDAQFESYVETLEAVTSQVEDVAWSRPQLRRTHRIVSGKAAAGRGPPCAARATETQVRTDAG